MGSDARSERRVPDHNRGADYNHGGGYHGGGYHGGGYNGGGYHGGGYNGGGYHGGGYHGGGYHGGGYNGGGYHGGGYHGGGYHGGGYHNANDPKDNDDSNRNYSKSGNGDIPSPMGGTRAPDVGSIPAEVVGSVHKSLSLLMNRTSEDPPQANSHHRIISHLNLYSGEHLLPFICRFTQLRLVVALGVQANWLIDLLLRSALSRTALLEVRGADGPSMIDSAFHRPSSWRELRMEGEGWRRDTNLGFNASLQFHVQEILRRQAQVTQVR
ncbi:unnamed protein product, partial [Cyprideis torosa]